MELMETNPVGAFFFVSVRKRELIYGIKSVIIMCRCV